MEVTKEFNGYKITNGHVRFKGDSLAKKLGLTGKVEMESEIKKITRKNEGVEEVLRAIVSGVKLKLTGHLPVENLRKIFGINTKGLKSGVYGYGENSLSPEGTYTWEELDVLGEEKKYIAFPCLIPTTGLKWERVNGEEEIAEIEIEFEAKKDVGGLFYYEAYESDLKGDSESIKTGWHNNFSNELVKSNEL